MHLQSIARKQKEHKWNSIKTNSKHRNKPSKRMKSLQQEIEASHFPMMFQGHMLEWQKISFQNPIALKQPLQMQTFSDAFLNSFGISFIFGTLKLKVSVAYLKQDKLFQYKRKTFIKRKYLLLHENGALHMLWLKTYCIQVKNVYLIGPSKFKHGIFLTLKQKGLQRYNNIHND